mmetsp:Transcript_18748/g.71322  ORF Transcript_18748/g.71322 Transcript_18748/m.71322 type:complete len:223 (-) Transcript_18748:632-1300(-)
MLRCGPQGNGPRSRPAPATARSRTCEPAPSPRSSTRAWSGRGWKCPTGSAGPRSSGGRGARESGGCGRTIRTTRLTLARSRARPAWRRWSTHQRLSPRCSARVAGCRSARRRLLEPAPRGPACPGIFTRRSRRTCCWPDASGGASVAHHPLADSTRAAPRGSGLSAGCQGCFATTRQRWQASATRPAPTPAARREAPPTRCSCASSGPGKQSTCPTGGTTPR